MTTSSRWFAALLVTPRIAAFLVCLACLACGKAAPKELPAFGEVLVSIDTDAPVPQLIGRLRIDLFDEHGSWFDSRDIARTDPADWPASFSVYTTDEKTPRTIFLRARAYLEGRTRDYRGERFEDRTPYVEPHVANTLDELCTALPKLELGQDLTLRSGRRPLTGNLPYLPPGGPTGGSGTNCKARVEGGSVAAQLDISEAGDYQVKATLLAADLGGSDTSVAIRKDCREPLSQVACADDYYDVPTSTEFDQTADSFARLVTHLEPGSYSVLASGYYPTPVDFTLRADLAANANQSPLPPQRQMPSGGLPRLVVNNVPVTPAEEPQPLLTIDRLALLKLVPGKKQLAPIVLHLACGGLMAKLSKAATNAAPVLSEAETCVDAEGERVPLREEMLEPFTGAPKQSRVGTFLLGEACPERSGESQAICIPPGAFVLGSPDTSPYFVPSVPERFAVMNRFWLDKTEVTVGRWRAALRRNFRSPDITPVENNGPIVIADGSVDVDQHFFSECTFSAPGALALPREDFPLTCVDWYAARAFCQFEGGDLPTEAQWEYAASKAGRSFEARFPWGDLSEGPTCDQTVFLRDSMESQCGSESIGPVAVTDPAAENDATPLGVLDLGGNVGEWALDSYASYDSPCWNGTTLTNPVCWEANAPLRSLRGGDWASQTQWLLTSARVGSAPSGGYPAGFFGDGHITYELSPGFSNTGFRCAYQEEPK
jgi:formylglycine-generating enzyme required for sulfatase activity